MSIVSTFVALMASFDPALTAPTAASLAVLARGAVLSPAKRTVTACLVAAWPWVGKHWSAYENVVRRSRVDLKKMEGCLVGLVLRLVPAHGPILLAVDETLVRRWGPHVVGLGMHRDTVRSTHGRNEVSAGHKWVVLSVVVFLPFMQRPVALPVGHALYTAPRHARRSRCPHPYRRHRTPGQLARVLVAGVARRVPERRFLLIGDGNYAAHGLARDLRPCSPHKGLARCCLVSRFRMDGATYAQPGPPCGRGRHRLKGPKLPSPREVVAGEDPGWADALVRWYGGMERVQRLCSRTGLWYKSGRAAKQIRWVVVRDPAGQRADEVFFTTDPDLTPAQIVSVYMSRWSLETTFQEAREFLGLETLRNWSQTAVKRSVPLLLGLYSLIVVWFALHVEEPRRWRRHRPWYAKPCVTFSDMLAAARADILGEIIYERPVPPPRAQEFWQIISEFLPPCSPTESQAA
jgi:hypothetical protein